jgi:hypothetical protein
MFILDPQEGVLEDQYMEEDVMEEPGILIDIEKQVEEGPKSGNLMKE